MGSPELTTVSLFSGIGGLDLGLERGARSLGIRTRPLCMVEGEAFGAFVLANAMQAGRLAPCPIWLGDVREFPAEQFPADLVVGGFPCQDISVAGKGAGIHGERSGLWFDMLDVAVRVEARYLFLENVAAITSRGLDAVLGSLAEVGFDAEWTCVRASDVGAPHRRARWFCLAYANGGRGDGREVPQIGQPLRPEPQRRSGAPLADTERPRRTATGERCDLDPGREPETGRGSVADPDRDGLGRSAERDSEPHPGRAAGGEGNDALRCDENVGNADRDEPGRRGTIADERTCGSLGEEARQPDGAGRVRPIPKWPPGRDDFDGWRYVLERWPWLAPATQPAIRGVAHGLPSGLDGLPRVDALRALGNAVVPDQAAAAFVHLWERAHV